MRVGRSARLVSGIVMMLFSGIIYAWSILKAPLQAEFLWDNAALGLNFTITMCFFCLGGILGSMLTKRTSPRNAVIIAAVLALAGFLISSRLNGSIMMLYVAYGAMLGLGIGIAYNVIISTVAGWYADRRATASGALMMGFGASSLVLGSVTQFLMDKIGWRGTYAALGIGLFAALFIGAFFMTPCTDAPGKAGAEPKRRDLTLNEALRTSDFWRFYFYAILLSSIGTGVISFAKDFMLSSGVQESLAVLSVGLFSVCNGFGRIITGALFDKIGAAKTMLGTNLWAIAAILVTILSVLSSSALLMLAGLCMLGLAYGSVPPITTGYVGHRFGTAHFPVIFSTINTTLAIASFSSTISGAIIKVNGSYLTVFLLFLAFASVGFIINIILQRSGKAAEQV